MNPAPRPFLITIIEDYFERMLIEVPGIKCLILDEETTSFQNKSEII